ncbi:MAG: type II toxin-antitoxin system Phd/YefM family antitoxin [Syntrophothermus sp.]
MLVVNYSTLKENLKEYCDKANDEFETIIVTRKNNKNIVILSEKEYNNLLENLYIISNPEYYNKLLESIEQLKNRTY